MLRTALLFFLLIASVTVHGQVSDTSYYYINKGWECFERKQYDSAIAYYSLSLETFPDQAAAYRFRGKAFLWRAKYQRAVEDLNKSLLGGEDSVDVLLLRAEAYYRLGKTKMSLADTELLDQFLLSPHQKIQRIVIRIENFELLNEFDNMDKESSEYASLAPGSAGAHLVMGKAKRARGKYEDAIMEFNVAIRLTPNVPRLYMERAMTYLLRGDMQAAAIDLAFVGRMELDLSDIDDLSMAYNVNFNYAKARQYAEKSISLAPEGANGYLNLGWAMWGEKNYEASIIHLNRAIQIDNAIAAAYLIRGKAYYMLKSYLKAEGDFKKCLSLLPRVEEPYVFLGYIYQSRKNVKEACDCWTKAYEIGKQADILSEIETYCKK